MTIIHPREGERTAPAAPTATTLRLDAASMAIKQTLGIDSEVRTLVCYASGEEFPSLHMTVEPERVLPEGREELARQIAEQMGATVRVRTDDSGKRVASASAYQSDGSRMSVLAELGEAGR